jgi:hypothetical protein
VIFGTSSWCFDGVDSSTEGTCSREPLRELRPVLEMPTDECKFRKRVRRSGVMKRTISSRGRMAVSISRRLGNVSEER